VQKLSGDEPDADVIYIQNVFPVKSIEDISELEEKIKNEEFGNKMVIFLSFYMFYTFIILFQF